MQKQSSTQCSKTTTEASLLFTLTVKTAMHCLRSLPYCLKHSNVQSSDGVGWLSQIYPAIRRWFTPWGRKRNGCTLLEFWNWKFITWILTNLWCPFFWNAQSLGAFALVGNHYICILAGTSCGESSKPDLIHNFIRKLSVLRQKSCFSIPVTKFLCCQILWM